uniref:Uncharacterized protein n=1 Tax=Loa loa TaxID=7209 RepID=A0A1I7VP75_LOALO
MPHGKLINRPVNMLYPLEVDDNETIQQPTPEIPIQNSEPEEPIATRTRRATRKRDGTRPIFMSITNSFTFKKIEKDTTCNFSKPYLMNGDIIIDEGVDKWQTKNAMNSDSKDQLIMKEINDEENKSKLEILAQRHKVINLKTNLPKTGSLWTELDNKEKS